MEMFSIVIIGYPLEINSDAIFESIINENLKYFKFVPNPEHYKIRLSGVRWKTGKN
jgi:hypothetical protein